MLDITHHSDQVFTNFESALLPSAEELKHRALIVCPHEDTFLGKKKKGGNTYIDDLTMLSLARKS